MLLPAATSLVIRVHCAQLSLITASSHQHHHQPLHQHHSRFFPTSLLKHCSLCVRACVCVCVCVFLPHFPSIVVAVVLVCTMPRIDCVYLMYCFK